MLPTETADERGEIEFGTRLIHMSIVWIIATIAAGGLLVFLAPWMQGMF